MEQLEQNQFEVKDLGFEYSEKHNELDKAMFDFQAKGIVVKKEAVNPAFNKKYADLADVKRAIQPALTECGLLVNYFPAGTSELTLKITHVESEQWLMCHYTINPVNAFAQALGSAITYGRRYSICAVLDVTVDGDDDDGNSASGTPVAQQQPTQGRAATQGTKEKAILKKDSPEYVKAVDFLLAGKDAHGPCTMERLEKKYTISTATKKELTTAVEAKKQPA